MSSVTVKVEGLRDLDRALGQLKESTAKGVLRRVGIAALQPMAATARALAPDDPRTNAPKDLRASIKVSTSQKSGRQISFTLDGPSTVQVFMGPTKGGYPEAIIQEFGAAPHIIQRKSGAPMTWPATEGGAQGATIVRHPGNAPHPFMRPAFDQHAAGVIDYVARELGVEIQRTAERAGRRAAAAAARRGG